MNLNVEKLTIAFSEVSVVRDVSFSLKQGEALAIVGESGCGKTITAQALLQLLPSSAQIKQGRILLNNVDLLQLPEKEMRAIRGKEIGMIFQDPMSALNPSMKIGLQIAETMIYHRLLNRSDALKRSEELLRLVGISEPALRISSYPHQLSGGMRQRAALAIALASNPSLLIADEPTTALDTQTQTKILDLLATFRSNLKMGLILITHNLQIVEDICEKIIVMYAGAIVEQGAVKEVFTNPKHPYTQMLLRSIPHLDAKQGVPLPVIEGAPPNLTHLPPGCPFAERCPHAMKICRERTPPLLSRTSCWMHDDS